MGGCRRSLTWSAAVRALSRLLAGLWLLAALRPAAFVRAWPGVPPGAYWAAAVEGHVKAVAVADLEGDGWPEIIGGTDTGLVVAWAAGGQPLWQFAVDTEWVTRLSSADLDQDGRAEVLVIAAGILPTQYLYVLRADGALWWSHQVREDLWSALAVNLDGDADLEVLLAARRPAVLDSDGSAYPNWPAEALQTPHLRVADWDGDGASDVIALRPEDLELVRRDGTRQPFALAVPKDVRAVEPIDLDGDGRLELALQTDSGLSLVGNDGVVVWTHHPPEALIEPLLAGFGAGPQGPGQLLVAGAKGVRALDPAGQVRWEFTLGRAAGQPTSLSADHDLILLGTSSGQVYLLDRQGHELAQYRTDGATSFALVTELNGDGHPEVLVAAGGQLSLYGAPAGPSEIGTRWSTTTPGPAVTLAAGDVNGDGWPEVLVGGDGATLLDAAGRRLWQAPPGAAPAGTILDPSSGFLQWAGNSLRRRDGQGLVLWGVSTLGTIRAVAATARSAAVLGSDGQVELLSLQDGTRLRGPAIAAPVADLAAGESDLVVVTRAGQAMRLSDDGTLLWEAELAQPAEAVTLAGDGSALIRAADRLIELDRDGAIRWMWQTRAPERITAAAQGRDRVAVGTDMRVVLLDGAGAEVLSQSLGEVISAVALADIDGDRAEEVLAATVQGRVALLSAGGQTLWQGQGRERVDSLAVADLDGDGGPEILAGFEDGRVTAYGYRLHQPPWLAAPAVTAVGSGFQYTIGVHDLDGEPVTITLEIWDPSGRQWRAQGSAPAAAGTGTLAWNLATPFDTWDAGQDSAFRFDWAAGEQAGQTAAFPGPRRIALAPWYVTYGRVAGLAALLVAVPGLLAVLVWRVRAHRRSPLGQAEAALLRLTLDPEDALIELRRLLSDEARALPLLAHLPGLAREARQPQLADLLEAAYLALAKPEMMPEALRSLSTALDALGQGPRLDGARQVYAVLAAAVSTRAIAGIAGLGPQIEALSGRATADLVPLQPICAGLGRLGGVARTLRAAEQLEDLGDQVLYLAEAAADLQLIQQSAPPELIGLERRALEAVVRHWAELVAAALQQRRGQADLSLALSARQLVIHEEIRLLVTLTNRGRSPATDVSVELCPGEALLPLQAARVASLGAGASERLELPAQACGTDGWQAITLVATWDDRVQLRRSAQFTERIRLLSAPRLYTPIPNPYSTGRPLAAGSPLFFGRNEIIDFIAEKLAGGHLVVLVGERRIGKTSLLQQLAARLGDRWLTAYLDGQALGVEGGLPGWLADAALEVARACGAPDRPPSSSDFRQQPGPIFEAYLKRLATSLLPGRRLLILLDEFEEIEARVSAGELPPAIFPYLRHLFQAGEAGFLLAGTQRLEALSPQYWNPLFNLGVYREVGPLEEAAARRLILAPVEGHLLYDDLAVDKLLRLSGRQPYFLQLLCHCVVTLCNQQRLPYATVAEVDLASDEALSLGRAHLRFLWASAGPGGQALMGVLARLVADGQPRTAEAMAEREMGQGEVQPSQLPAMLDSVMGLGLVRRLANGQYDFAADLMRLWVDRAGD